jgi:hypothetical protein
MPVSSSSPRPLPFALQKQHRIIGAALLVAVVSLGGKIAQYVRADPDLRTAHEARLVEFLARHGLLLIGAPTPNPTTGYRTLEFHGSLCEGIVGIAFLPASGDAAPAFEHAAGANTRVFYIHQGRASERPPRFAYVRAKTRALLDCVGVRRNAPDLVVSEPSTCQLAHGLPWPDL